MSEYLDVGVDLDSKDFLRMLDYEKQIFLDILHADGLVVCAKGLSCNLIIQNLMKVYCDPGNLVLIINALDHEEEFFIKYLDSEHTYVAAALALEREKNYLKGGIHFMSTRILVVDLLKQRVPISNITGVIVLRAHAIIESCQEAFALRLYRQNNKTGFIKAFSNNVESFTFGYGHVEKVMRSLFVKELYIWPRFHVSVINSLKNHESTVIELHIPMSAKMISLQTCILDLMNFTCRELKNHNKNIELYEITVENCLIKKFHKILQTQLDCVWHQLSSTTKQLLQDLKVLRGLMVDVIYNDSVTLYSRMKEYRTAEYAKKNLSWILLDPAELMFKLTKERVYNAKEEFDPEPCPKWKILSDILRVQIPADIKSNRGNRTQSNTHKVLILCQSARTCSQIHRYLSFGPERYLFQKALMYELPLTKIAKAYSTFDIHEIKSEILNITERENKETSAMKSVKVIDESKKDQSKGKVSKEIEDIQNCEKVDALSIELSEKNECYGDEAMNKTCYFLTFSQRCTEEETKDSDVVEIKEEVETFYESFPEMENLDVSNITEDKPIICIQTFKNGDRGTMSLDKTLNEMCPNYIIMYESNVTAIRQIEVFESRLQRPPADRIKLFFLIHNGTVEEQSYLTNLRREKQAFELLIETKRKMVVPEYQDGKSDGSLLLHRELLQKSPKKNTRQAGGQEQTIEIPRIVVDMREFRSELPCLIHKRGIEVDPVTITIGDYILTPEICIERKSISDLIGSLNSGRLYNQCIQMSRYYNKPMLLIEFDQNAPFNLQGHYLVAGEKSNVGIMQKLQLLTLHFPKLRIVWSPSPYATAQLFEELKQGKEQPDAKLAAVAGTDADTVDIDIITDNFNSGIHDFMIKLPGITSKNIGRVMSKGGSLDNLMKMTMEELIDLLGNTKDANLFWDIVHLRHEPVTEQKNSRPTRGKFFGKSSRRRM